MGPVKGLPSAQSLTHCRSNEQQTALNRRERTSQPPKTHINGRLLTRSSSAFSASSCFARPVWLLSAAATFAAASSAAAFRDPSQVACLVAQLPASVRAASTSAFAALAAAWASCRRRQGG